MKDINNLLFLFPQIFYICYPCQMWFYLSRNIFLLSLSLFVTVAQISSYVS